MKYLLSVLFVIMTIQMHAQNGTLIRSPSGDAYIETSMKRKGGNDTLAKIYALPLSTLRERANAKTIAGCLFLGVGITCITTAVVNNARGTQQEPDGLLLTIGGGMIMVPGIILTGLGIHQEIIYTKRKKAEVAIIITPAGAGLALNF